MMMFVYIDMKWYSLNSCKKLLFFVLQDLGSLVILFLYRSVKVLYIFFVNRMSFHALAFAFCKNQLIAIIIDTNVSSFTLRRFT
jgi:hypothetical protein